MNIGDLFLRLLIDDSDLEKQVVSRAQRAGDLAGRSMGARMADGLSKGATNIGKSLATMGRNFSAAGRGISTNLTLPILAAGAAVTHFALDFDTTLRRVVGLTDVTQEEIAGIREEILKMAPAVGKGPNELAEAFYFVASAGFKAEEAMEVLGVAARAAATGLGETQTVAQVLGSVINAYGKENITAARAADILIESVSQGTAEADAFAGVIGRVVPIAASLGVSFDQVGAALAAMTLSGIDADEAATSLRQILVSLLKPAVEAEDALGEMGLSSEALRKQLREEGLLATLRTLEERFAGNEAATAKVFGNVRALAGVQNLLGLSAEQLDAVFAKVNDSVGRLGEAYEETEGPQREIDRAMASMQVTAIELGADTLPIVVDILKEIAAVAKGVAAWWKSLDAGTRKQIISWLAWVAVAGPALLLIGKLATGLSALFRVVGFLFGAKGIPRLITAMKAMRIASFGVLGPLGLLLLALVTLYELLDGSDEAKAFEMTAKRMGISVEEAQRRIEEFAEKTGSSFEEAVAAVEAGTDDVARSTGGLVGAVRREWARMELEARAAGEGIPTVLAATLEDGSFVVEESAGVMADPIAEALEKAKQDVADAANDIIETIANTLFEGKADLKAASQEVIDDILVPYADMKRRLDLEAELARGVWIKGLTSSDAKDRATTALYLKGLLEEYELLAPGAMGAGKLVNPALQAGINSNLEALKTYLESQTGEILDQYELADELYRMGYVSLAEYVRGQEDARVGKLMHELYLGKIAVIEAHDINLYDEGYSSAITYGEGFADGGEAVVIPGLQRFAGKITRLLQFAGSPPYTHSREIGEGVGQSFTEAVVAALQGAVPRFAAAVATLGSSMTLSPAAAGASIPSVRPYGFGQASAGGDSVVNNTWNLHVGGAQQSFRNRDDFIRALDSLSRFGGKDARLADNG